MFRWLAALVLTALAAQAQSVMTFSDLPDAYFFASGDQNIGSYYSGITFGPDVTALSVSRFGGYNSAAFPPHSGDVAIWDPTDPTITISFTSAVQSFGIWYTALDPLTLQAFDQNGKLVGSATGNPNTDGTTGASTFLSFSSPVISSVALTGTPGLFVLSDLTVTTLANLPLIGGVLNAASGQAVIAPNTWVSIYGSNFAATGFSDDWSKSIVGGSLPTTLDGVSVSVGGYPAYVAYVSSGQINILTPNVAPGSASVTVTTAAGTSAPVNVTSQQFSPAFFPWPNGQPVATHLDYSWAVKNATFAGVTTVPAKPGEYIILWGTGFGPTTPTAPSGVTIPATTTYYTANAVSVTIGSVTALVYGTALASGFAGLYQVVALVPATLSSGDYALVATVGGVATAATTLTVHN
jgi:uncharacterized protein (TIGR03437 family)